MPKKKKQLPEPPGGPFSRRRPFSGTDSPETSDRLTAALAEGRLEEFMEKEFGDVPHAKDLAMMMLGATGMMPAGATSKVEKKKTSGKKPAARTSKRSSEKSPEASEEVLKAAGEGDVKKLGNLLSQELRKRSGGGEATQKEESTRETYIDKADIDTLLQVAAENNVPVDWVLARAIKLYARDYRTTGRI